MNVSLEYAFEYLDNQKVLYNKYTSNDDYIFDYNLPETDMELVNFFIKDKNTEKTIISGTCNLIAVYNMDYKIWSWAWSIMHHNMNINFLAKKLLLYSLQININNTLNTITKSELLNTKLHVTSKLEINKLISLALYLTKSEWYYCEDIKALDTNNKEQIITQNFWLFRDIKIHDNDN